MPPTLHVNVLLKKYQKRFAVRRDIYLFNINPLLPSATKKEFRQQRVEEKEYLQIYFNPLQCPVRTKVHELPKF